MKTKQKERFIMKKLDLGIKAKAYGNLFLEGAKDAVGEPLIMAGAFFAGIYVGVVSKDITKGVGATTEALGLTAISSGFSNVIINRQEAVDEIEYYTKRA